MQTATPYFPPLRVEYPFSFDLSEVASYGNAVIAYGKASRRKKNYRQVKVFDEDHAGNLHKLSEDFLSGQYRTGRYELKTINDSGKERQIAKTMDFRDRIAQWMIGNYLVPQLTAGYYSEHSHAAIPGKGIHTALEEAVRYIGEYEYVAKLDLKKFFMSINRQVLKSLCDDIFASCPQLRDIVRHIIDDAPGDKGVPIGNLLSQFLANIYLTPLDKWLESIGAVWIRYMDDLVIFAKTIGELRKKLRDVAWFVESRLFVRLKENWQIFEIAVRGLDFVGYRIWKGLIMLRKSTLAKFRRASFKIQKHLARKGFVTSSQESTIFSYLGWLMHCSKCVRDKLFNTYFRDIIWTAGLTVKKKSKLRKYYDLPPPKPKHDSKEKPQRRRKTDKPDCDCTLGILH